MKSDSYNVLGGSRHTPASAATFDQASVHASVLKALSVDEMEVTAAVPLSLYRPKSTIKFPRFKEHDFLFNSLGYDKKLSVNQRHRIYLSFGSSQLHEVTETDFKPDPVITSFLKDFQIKDFRLLTGEIQVYSYAPAIKTFDLKGRIVLFGKLLSRLIEVLEKRQNSRSSIGQAIGITQLGNTSEDRPLPAPFAAWSLSRIREVQKNFLHDKRRVGGQTLKNTGYLVISRHPYDILGASFDRGWTSCLHIKDGLQSYQLPDTIKEGTLVCYLIKELPVSTGVDALVGPVARIFIKPVYDHRGNRAFYVDRPYGTSPPIFKRAVDFVVERYLNIGKPRGLYRFSETIHNDTNGNTVPIHMSFKDLLELSNPSTKNSAKSDVDPPYTELRDDDEIVYQAFSLQSVMIELKAMLPEHLILDLPRWDKYWSDTSEDIKQKLSTLTVTAQMEVEKEEIRTFFTQHILPVFKIVELSDRLVGNQVYTAEAIPAGYEGQLIKEQFHSLLQQYTLLALKAFTFSIEIAADQAVAFDNYFMSQTTTLLCAQQTFYASSLSEFVDPEIKNLALNKRINFAKSCGFVENQLFLDVEPQVLCQYLDSLKSDNPLKQEPLILKLYMLPPHVIEKIPQIATYFRHVLNLNANLVATVGLLYVKEYSDMLTTLDLANLLANKSIDKRHYINDNTTAKLIAYLEEKPEHVSIGQFFDLVQESAQAGYEHPGPPHTNGLRSFIENALDYWMNVYDSLFDPDSQHQTDIPNGPLVFSRPQVYLPKIYTLFTRLLNLKAHQTTQSMFSRLVGPIGGVIKTDYSPLQIVIMVMKQMVIKFSTLSSLEHLLTQQEVENADWRHLDNFLKDSDFISLPPILRLPHLRIQRRSNLKTLLNAMDPQYSWLFIHPGSRFYLLPYFQLTSLARYWKTEEGKQHLHDLVDYLSQSSDLDLFLQIRSLLAPVTYDVETFDKLLDSISDDRYINTDPMRLIQRIQKQFVKNPLTAKIYKQILDKNTKYRTDSEQALITEVNAAVDKQNRTDKNVALVTKLLPWADLNIDFDQQPMSESVKTKFGNPLISTVSTLKYGHQFMINVNVGTKVHKERLLNAIIVVFVLHPGVRTFTWLRHRLANFMWPVQGGSERIVGRDPNLAQLQGSPYKLEVNEDYIGAEALIGLLVTTEKQLHLGLKTLLSKLRRGVWFVVPSELEDRPLACMILWMLTLICNRHSSVLPIALQIAETPRLLPYVGSPTTFEPKRWKDVLEQSYNYASSKDLDYDDEEFAANISEEFK